MRSFCVPAMCSALLLAGAIFPADPAAADSVAVLVTLSEPASADVYLGALARKQSPVDATASAKAQLQRVQREQDAFTAGLKSTLPRHDELYRLGRLANGIAMFIDPEDWPALASLKGVRAVRPLETLEIHLESSVPFIGATELWARPDLPLTGEGLRIGIIDTGINYHHAALGGPNDPARYDADAPSIIGDGPFPNAKVVGGHDFAGDTYNPSVAAQRVPRPDPDPLDLQGHGTHVAAIAAGWGVLDDLQGYPGPYAAPAELPEFKLSPGVAPDASLYALKVFGRSGGTNLVPLAIEWAVDPDGDGDFSDRLDVINLSLGYTWGDGQGSVAAVCDVAAQLGVVVVASAGNDTRVLFAHASPAAGARVVSVAAVQDDGFVFLSNGEQAQMLGDSPPGFTSRGPGRVGRRLLLKPDLAAPGVIIHAASNSGVGDFFPGTTMSGTSMSAPHAAGVLAIMRQNWPDWPVHRLKARLMNTTTVDRRVPGQTEREVFAPPVSGAGRIDAVAALHDAVVAYDAGAPQAVSLTFQTIDVREITEETRTLRVRNLGDAARAYRVGHAVSASLPGVEILAQPDETGPILPGAYADIAITLRADPAAMAQARPPDLDEAQLGRPRAWFGEVSGHILLHPVDTGAPLHVPYYGAPRPVAALRAESNGLDLSGGADEAAIPLVGTGAFPNGDTSDRDRPRVVPAALLHIAPSGSASAEGPSHIRYIGITNDYHAAGRTIAETWVGFAIAAEDNWLTPNEGNYLVRVDTNHDGVADYTVFNATYWDPATRINFEYSDAHTSIRALGATLFQGWHVAADLNGLPPDLADTRLFFNNVMLIPVRAHSIGLREAGPTSFTFWVESYFTEQAIATVTPDETSPKIRYEITQPGIDLTNGQRGATIRAVDPGDYLPLRFRFDDYFDNRIQGALLLHLHNGREDRAEPIWILTPGDSDGDGIPDSAEGFGDSDGDGIPDFLDFDSDGDGLPDAQEWWTEERAAAAGLLAAGWTLAELNDIDGDGVPNYLDLDSDGDGIPDAVEGLVDSDRDGMPDAYDLDSDGDGIPDAVEGIADLDGDGVPNYLDLDSDGDTLPDWMEGMDDLDGDGIPNWADLDSDGDGLSDHDEYRILGTDPYNADTDDDGFDDGEEIAMGRDPLRADPPDPVLETFASRGEYADRVNIGWVAARGAREFRVWRSATGNFADAIQISGWIQGQIYGDYTARPPQSVRQGGCNGRRLEPVLYTYWVESRNAGGPAPVGPPADGYR